ncbi:MAG: hypothetical protein EOP88_04135 [Verrucomicrobiaceae bacterium]|nr:MAG: hypothetical protein EOP88_04135 [Verrucomicrobiaceae bacterium]
MDPASPYQPPLPQGPPDFPLTYAGDPPAVKVFGILHLVFAGLGILFAAWGLFVAIVGNPILKLQSAPGMESQVQAQLDMQEKIKPMTLTSGVLSLLVAVPMIIAGVRLVKKRGSGLKWSNIYAFSSLAAKAVNLVLTFTVMVPAMEEMTRTIIGSSGAPASASGVLSGVMMGSAVGGVLITCVYPVLTLILLNRPPVKDWAARQPG